MSSKKVHLHTYIVLQNGHIGQPTTIGRYRVGAKNKDDSEKVLRAKIGKHTSVRCYYEVTETKLLLPYGEVIKEC